MATYTSQSYKPWYLRVYGGMPLWAAILAAVALVGLVAYALLGG